MPDHPDPPVHQQGSRLRIRWGYAAVWLVLLGLIVHLLLPRLASIRGTWLVLRELDWWLFVPAFVAQVFSYVGTSYLLQAVIALTGQRLPLGVAAKIILAGGSISLVAGGIVGEASVSYRWSRAYGIRPEGALLGGWMPSLFNLAVLSLLALISLVELFFLRALTREEAWGFGGSVALLGTIAALFVWAVVRPEGATRILLRIVRLAKRVPGVHIDPVSVEHTSKRFLEGLALLGSHGWKRVLLGAAGNIGFDVLTLYLVFIAAGNPVPIEVLLTGYGLPQLLGKVVVLPGGLGVVEGGMVALYHTLGVPLPTAVLVVLIYRVLSFWFPTLVGFLLVPVLERSGRGAGGVRGGG